MISEKKLSDGDIEIVFRRTRLFRTPDEVRFRGKYTSWYQYPSGKTAEAGIATMISEARQRFKWSQKERAKENSQ